MRISRAKVVHFQRTSKAIVVDFQRIFTGHPGLQSLIFKRIFEATVLDFKGHPELEKYNFGLFKKPADI